MFLIGLLTGLVEQHFTNVRMGLAAHLEGVMNGTFLLAVGAIWNEVRLSEGMKAMAYWALLVGTYSNWFVATSAAVLGSVIILAAVLLMFGLRSTAKPSEVTMRLERRRETDAMDTQPILRATVLAGTLD